MNKRSFIAVGALVSCLCLSSISQAAYVETSVGGSARAGMTYVTFDEGDTYPVGFELTLTPDAQLVTGEISGQYAAPYLSGNNNLYFGDDLYTGDDTTQYVTTGKLGAGGSVTMTFDSNQWYFGLLWGSVDNYNKLEFFRDDVSLFSVGTDDLPAPQDGNQGLTGTLYVNIFAADHQGFNKVVATSTQYAFEFDNVAYGVPEPAAMLVWGFLGIVGLCWLRRRKA